MMRKSKPIKYITAGILTLACLLFMCFPVLAEGEEEVWPVPQSVETESVMIMELTTSTVLYEKDADSMRYPASTTKILTCLLALENSSMDEMVTFSERAVDLEEAASNIDAVAGEGMFHILHSGGAAADGPCGGNCSADAKLKGD